MESAIEAVRRSLRRGKLVAFTGAGISAESHVPTFRGADGLWRNYSPESLATAEAFFRNPRLVWEWYDWRRGIVHAAQPNPGHLALAELQQRALEKFTLVTQNTDGLHERAGSQDVVKLHGDIWWVQCTQCGWEGRNEQVPLDPLPPRCRCGGLLRPGVVWFGEMLPVDPWQRATEAARTADLFMAIGTSAVVYPAAGLMDLAQQSGARIVIVNPDSTPADAVAEWILRGPAGDILPRLL